MNLTPLGFGVLVAILLVVAVIVVVAENLRDRDEAPTPDPDPALDSSHCQIGDCREVAWSVYDKHPAGWLWVCRGHDAMVQAWVGPRRVRSIEAPFDQEAS